MGKRLEPVKARHLGPHGAAFAKPSVLKAFPTARKSPESVAFMS